MPDGTGQYHHRDHHTSYRDPIARKSPDPKYILTSSFESVQVQSALFSNNFKARASASTAKEPNVKFGISIVPGMTKALKNPGLSCIASVPLVR